MAAYSVFYKTDKQGADKECRYWCDARWHEETVKRHAKNNLHAYDIISIVRI